MINESAMFDQTLAFDLLDEILGLSQSSKVEETLDSLVKIGQYCFSRSMSTVVTVALPIEDCTRESCPRSCFLGRWNSSRIRESFWPG